MILAYAGGGGRICRPWQICADARDDHCAQAEAFLAMEDVFGPPLPDHDGQVAAIADMLRRLTDGDVRAVLREVAKACS
ncbi:hypothetical protein [Gluconacetobacter tumulicola]|uniref:hypothetical protein n=1 Tax=Gluconacetobacter tumulicola TaxID=1017177 RepID=UPI001FEB00EB|nr:hypothetical protein [Gluconacetobacter tumulicola]